MTFPTGNGPGDLLLMPVLARAAGTYNGGSESCQGLRRFLCQLDVTAVTAGTTLDAYIQTSVDGGDTWQDVAHFTQVTTATGRWYISILNEVAPATNATPEQNGTLAAATARNGPMGALIRAKLVQVGTSYTAAVRVHGEP